MTEKIQPRRAQFLGKDVAIQRRLLRGVLAHLVRRSEAGPNDGAPHVLLVCPPPVGPIRESAESYVGAEAKSRELPREFARVAAAVDCEWMDAGEVIVTSPLDGWHLEAREHQVLGIAVAARVRRILP